MNRVYLDTARLLARIAPFVFADDVFALKGGTAINLFVRDMPRLSVDFDLVFVDALAGREAALARIDEALNAIGSRLKQRGYTTFWRGGAVGERKLFVRDDAIEAKIEVNTIMRGTIHPVRPLSLVPRAADVLAVDVEIPVVSFDDIYGGKLVAAMDRQHPRDLFDVMQLFEHEGVTPGVRRAFVVYLAASPRPMHEVLDPTRQEIATQYANEFAGMTAAPVALERLLDARERMIATLRRELDADERGFLLSIASAAPQWDLLGLADIERLPALRWKLHNLDVLRRNDAQKFAAQVVALRACLD
ncbi:MAG TPA: nucleotidyl transferase AbiEii/AbiGii toxin family protein [Tahibacter sp.]|nr:nucleotidyl transferase AbiEii/AbiGii toxin family protein [Tahibacter sp.]